MIQRIQTVYLALAVILLVLCCCMPLAQFEQIGMGKPAVLYSLVLIGGDGVIESYLPASLFFIMVIAEIILVLSIFSFKTRKRQINFCKVAMFIELLWLLGYALILYLFSDNYTPHVSIGAFFPLIAIIFTFMAQMAIKKDENLVRSADRIR